MIDLLWKAAGGLIEGGLYVVLATTVLWYGLKSFYAVAGLFRR